jgi:hypothetical protein
MNNTRTNIRFIITLLCLALGQPGGAFVVQPKFGVARGQTKVLSTSAIDALEEIVSALSTSEEESTAIRAPLKYLGPYPALGLRFPNLATASQRAKNVTGISLDYVLDTAANTNTINGQVAQELQLEIVGEALPGVGSSGTMAGGHTYSLGDTQLEGIYQQTEDGKNEPFLFMQNLTASALPVASPASAGLLSLAFLYCFEGGVEFNWGSPNSMGDGMMAEPPSVTFFSEKDALANKAIEGMSRIKIENIPVTQLPSIMLNINGVEIRALLDTGSPVTVLNSQAAAQAGIETITLPSQSSDSKNPFAAVANRFKEAQAISKATAEGNVLTIAGMNGPVYLLKSTEATEISAIGDVSKVSFGKTNVYVGDIPGLAALNGIGVDAPPAVVLGMDVLRTKPKMILRAQDNEVYF